MKIAKTPGAGTLLIAAALILPAAGLAFEAGPSPDATVSVDLPAEAPSVGGDRVNLISNGDFEANTFPAGCNFNQVNADVTSGMSDLTAFGGAEEIDVMNDGTDCGYASPPASGETKIAVHRTLASGGVTDAFAFHLSSPVVAGVDYRIDFYLESNLDFDPDVGAIEIGVSTSATAFGTLAYTAASTTGGWKHEMGVFTAPAGGGYLTVRVADGHEAWIHLDAFILEEDSTPAGVSDWGTIKALYN